MGIKTDNFKIFHPGMDVNVIDRTGAGDCYAAGFLTKLNEMIISRNELRELLKKENSENLDSKRAKYQ